MSSYVIQVPRVRSWRNVALGAAALIALVLYFVPASNVAIGRLWEPRRVADRTVLVAQREAVEQALARIYAKSVAQLRSTRELRLPISDAAAQAIQDRTLESLRGIRRNALIASARIYGLTPAETDSYVRAIEPQLDRAPSEPTNVLLTPGLYQVVARAGELSAQAADEGTRDMTKPPATPSPTGSPGPTPTRSP